MLALHALLASLLLVVPTHASPVPTASQTGVVGVTVKTSLGSAQGAADVSGATRFAVKYASASRWQPSVMTSVWALPNGSKDPTALPLACPQPSSDENSAATSEDCLSMVLYVPATAAAAKNVPTLMWVHGGSFIVGSATGPGLDGSKLAAATNSIVAVVQYRLGALGFMAPNKNTNLAVKDLSTALSFLNKLVPSFGGDSSKITIAGQSSGASMVRALLAVPSASSLFQSAILHSDPTDFGWLSPGTQQTLQNYFTSSINCSATNSACLNAVSLDTILDAQNDLFNNAASLDPAAGSSEPIRPVHDGSFITSTLDSTSPFPHVSKPIILSNVQNEAGPAIYGNLPAIPESAFEPAVNATFGTPRTQTIVTSSHYSIPANDDIANFDARTQLQTLGTDYLWRCSGWTLARNWVQNGGRAFVGLYVVGATYPDNAGIDYCTQGGTVCHEDDIQIVFGTTLNPTGAQSALTAEIQARYASFLRGGTPNPAGSALAAWTPATTTDVHARLLGGSGEAAVGACDPSFWGDAVAYDYQVFGI